MKWRGRLGSGNIQDRRGFSGGRIAGGGIGAIVIAIIVYLLGGNPSQLFNNMQPDYETGQLETTAEGDTMAQFVSVVLKDTETVWSKLFDEMGTTYREPVLVLFRGQVESACGFASSASGPFYCPGDQKIYIDLTFCDELKTRFGASGDFAIAYVIAHEVGHHVQNLLGIMDKVNSQRSRLNETGANQLSVRVELQADFFSGIWAHYAQQMLNTLEAGDIQEALNAAAAVGDDNLQRKSQGKVVPDAFTHGSSAQRMEWFQRGLQSGDINQGDTFSGRI